MADKPQYAPPGSPPPNYGNASKPTHQDAGPYYPPNPTASPAPGPYNQMNPYGNQGMDMRAPDPAYGGYQQNNGPPPQGYYGAPAQGYYGPGPNQGGYYGGQPGGPPPQGMYYQQQPMGPGYYQDDRRGGSGGGICAGILGALACCCCLDMLF